MKYIPTLILLMYSLNTEAQRIYVVDRREEANKIVYKTRYFSEANLVVRRTYNIQDTAKKYHWFFVDSKYRADWIVYYTDKLDEADHVVYMTSREGLLGTYSSNKPIDIATKNKR